MNQSTCSVDTCTEPKSAKAGKGMCGTHYGRLRFHGDVRGKKCETCSTFLADVFENVKAQRWCSDACKPRCSVEGCEQVWRKLTYCASHAEQFRRKGVATPFAYKWSEQRANCANCGDEFAPGDGRRNHCSAKCFMRDHRHGGERPASRPCATCGTEIDLTAIGVGGRIKYARTASCIPCRSIHRFGMTAKQLAERDGANCGICGEPVDMGVTRKESVFSPSIDHIIPRSAGGTNDPTNLQLSHFWCNTVKSDRIGFRITT